MRTPAEIATAFAPTSMMTAERSFYLVGIGGAGMSSLAWMLQHRGARVQGSDSTPSSVVDQMERSGIHVDVGHQNAKIPTGSQLVLSDAIALEDSPEVAQARAMGAPIFRRSQLLGWLLQGKAVIAVTGTHGKTTTTSMIGAGLKSAGEDPTIVVGAYVPEFGASVVEGASNWAVVEACEAYDSFHDLQPQIVVLTNLELDHVDFHRSWDRLKESVVRFVRSIPPDGTLVYCEDDGGAQEIAAMFDGRKIGYSASSIQPSKIAASGAHNRSNAAGAAKAVEAAGFDSRRAMEGIAAFRGAERRLERIYDEEIAVVDDYAHHPTEIKASIDALREAFPGRRLTVVFQPHLYSRTENLIPEFAQALSFADSIVMTDIYPAREEPIPGVSSARIAESIGSKCRYVPSRHLLPRMVAKWTEPGDVVVGMGAGNIEEFAREFVAERRRPSIESILGGSKMRVVVVCGGDSAEREVSIHSGIAIERALRSKGHDVERVDLSERLLASGELKRWIGADRPDLAFLAVHGTNAEDGGIQGVFELLHVPYTGSSLQASALAMDKDLAKSILERHGIRVPKGVLVRFGATLDEALQSIREARLGARVIVKPNAQGSTIGLSFVDEAGQLKDAVSKAMNYGDVVVEQWVEGMEISVPVLGDRPLNPVEIAPDSGQYDFASKYIPGATTEIVPARLPHEALEQAKRIAVECHLALRCNGATRTDMIVSSEGIVVLEVNTLPGMTETSLLPNSARSMGIEMPELCEWIAFDALERYAKR